MGNTAITHDDTYTGARWAYGLTYRPLDYAAVPAGWIIGSDRPHESYPFGTIDYGRELRPQEIAAYQLTPLTPVPPELERCPDCHGEGYDAKLAIEYANRTDWYGTLTYAKCPVCRQRFVRQGKGEWELAITQDDEGEADADR